MTDDLCPYRPSINVPGWNGHPREVAEVLTLGKVPASWSANCGRMRAARLTVAGQLLRNEAQRHALLDLALKWQAQFLEKGWQ